MVGLVLDVVSDSALLSWNWVVEGLDLCLIYACSLLVLFLISACFMLILCLFYATAMLQPSYNPATMLESDHVSSHIVGTRPYCRYQAILSVQGHCCLPSARIFLAL